MVYTENREIYKGMYFIHMHMHKPCFLTVSYNLFTNNAYLHAQNDWCEYLKLSPSGYSRQRSARINYTIADS